jgi:F0F1-type ATP synthase assembly protein I
MPELYKESFQGKNSRRHEEEGKLGILNYKIEGKADTKPIKKTEDAAQGMFKKISDIDKKLNDFIGVKVFQEIGKAVSGALSEYDKFKKSLNDTGELKIAQQFKSIQTSIAGTLGFIRDELFKSLDNVFGGGFLKSLEEAVPKIGSHILAVMAAVGKIVENIKIVFSNLIKPDAWTEFFTNASTLASNFGAYLANVLKDAFSFAVNFFKWAFEKLNVFKLLWDQVKPFFDKVGAAFKRFFGIDTGPLDDDKDKDKPPPRPFPHFELSPETTEALDNIANGLDSLFDPFADGLGDARIVDIYKDKQQEAFNALSELIKKMNAPPEQAPEEKAPPEEDPGENLKKILDQIKKSAQDGLKSVLSESVKGFTDAKNRINNILGSAAGPGVDKIRQSMSALTGSFDNANKKIESLFDALKNAESAEKVAEISELISGEIKNIDSLAASMNALEKAAQKAKFSADLLGGILQALGDMGAVLQAVMSGNPMGIIITLITKLAETLNNLSAAFAAVQNIFTVLFDVIEDIAVNLGPILDLILRPFIEIFAAIGRVVGSVMNILAPFLGALYILEPLLGLISVIVNGIALGLAVFADALGVVWNAIAGLIQGLTFGIVNLPRLSTDNVERMNKSIDEGMNYEKYQNNSTSYTVAGDMYINIAYHNSYVNGDARQIAVQIALEIRRAQKEGYL